MSYQTSVVTFILNFVLIIKNIFMWKNNLERDAETFKRYSSIIIFKIKCQEEFDYRLLKKSL